MQVRHIIAGEFPPQPGGVSDYTERVVVALGQVGDHSHVWTQGTNSPSFLHSPNVDVHPCAGAFGRQDLKLLGTRLSAFPGKRQLLVQYVPHSFGCKAMNLRFAWWVRQRAKKFGDDVRIMFHEVAYPWVRKPLIHNMLAAVNEVMASLMARAASKVYVSTTAWNARLKRLGANEEKIVLLPIPSNIPEAVDPAAVAQVRRSLMIDKNEGSLVGHFGTYGSNVLQFLEPILREVLGATQAHVHLIGGGSDRFREDLVRRYPNFAARISSTGRVDANLAACHIRACDVMIQPFGDGANTRRTSLMACLINHRATISTDGHNCESIWTEGSGVQLAELHNPQSALAHLRRLLESPRERELLGAQGHEFYQQNFSLGRTVAKLCLP